ncbi:hypothetical protein AEAC466_00870 [Asticcacaulis sp. AC466]|uniref:hypothetical protein n=1 Tax=Asticcacaulis sp. AC466 TaxID=1282362 RepID=UPI0003C40500|nr:hypothetical protein [Asticcacaulis sp. AC466]ESQ85757.1 hypothetical protein AEAC466_00870 [Asticcacaulis sp. AC466]
MKYLRWFIVAIVIAYVGWIAFPVVKAFLLPPDVNGPTIAARSMDQSDYHGGFDAPAYQPPPEPMADSIQGDTAVQAIVTDNKPVIFLWSAVIGLYLLAALLHANGNIRAAFVYLIGFIADLILTYLTNGDKSFGLMDKIYTVLSGWDPRYVLTLIALVMGFFVYLTSFRPQKRMSAAVP